MTAEERADAIRDYALGHLEAAEVAAHRELVAVDIPDRTKLAAWHEAQAAKMRRDHKGSPYSLGHIHAHEQSARWLRTGQR